MTYMISYSFESHKVYIYIYDSQYGLYIISKEYEIHIDHELCGQIP